MAIYGPLKYDAAKTMLVWNWEDAPEEFRKLSDNGGDEDIVVFVPEGLDPHWRMLDVVNWETGTDVPGGTVYIIAHS